MRGTLKGWLGVKSTFWSWGTHSGNRDVWKPLEANCEDFGFIKAAFKGTFHSVLLFPSVNTCAVRGAVPVYTSLFPP